MTVHVGNTRNYVVCRTEHRKMCEVGKCIHLGQIIRYRQRIQRIIPENINKCVAEISQMSGRRLRMPVAGYQKCQQEKVSAHVSVLNGIIIYDSPPLTLQSHPLQSEYSSSDQQAPSSL